MDQKVKSTSRYDVEAAVLAQLATFWFGYCNPPIDSDWSLLQTVKEVACKLAKREINDLENYIEHREDDEDDDIALYFQESTALERFTSDFSDACLIAKKIYWEGDYNYGPCVFWLPNPDGYNFYYAFV